MYKSNENFVYKTVKTNIFDQTIMSCDSQVYSAKLGTSSRCDD